MTTLRSRAIPCGHAPTGSLALIAILFLSAATPPVAAADHNSLHATPCNADDVVGGGALGDTPGPVGPPGVLGWDVGTGQCNGSFAVTRDTAFPSDGGGIELGMRIEHRSVGQVTRIDKNEYEVETGYDTTAGATNRAWWNFQHSIACDCDIDDLDALSFTISTQQGPNQPVASSFNMLELRGDIDDRNAGPNPTPEYSDLYQTSQNPEFGWFAATDDDDANPDGDFDYDAEGAWLMTLTAEKDGHRTSVSICVHTPNAQCWPLDNYACYRVKQISKLPSNPAVSVADQLSSDGDVLVKKARELCVPASVDGAGIFDAAGHLVCYDVKSKQAPPQVDIEVMNAFTGDGTQQLRLSRRQKMHRLCVPSTKPVVRPVD